MFIYRRLNKTPYCNAHGASNTQVETLYEQQLQKHGLTQRDFIIRTVPALTPKGSSRKLYAEVKDLIIGELEGDEFNEGMKKFKLEFSLDKGCYATILIQELF